MEENKELTELEFYKKVCYELVKNSIGKLLTIDMKQVPKDFNVHKFIKIAQKCDVYPIQKDITLEEAIEVLCNALKEDSSYYISWQANIAMAFQDEFKNQEKYHNGFTRWLFLENGLHTISNEAAKNFLNSLISK